MVRLSGMALGVFTAVRSILRTLDMVEDKELEKAFEQLYLD